MLVTGVECRMVTALQAGVLQHHTSNYNNYYTVLLLLLFFFHYANWQHKIHTKMVSYIKSKKTRHIWNTNTIAIKGNFGWIFRLLPTSLPFDALSEGDSLELSGSCLVR